MVMVNLIFKQIFDITTLISSDKIVRRIATVLALFTIFIGIFVSFPAASILFVSYIFGLIVSWNLIKYRKHTGLYLQRLISFYHGRISGKNVLRQSCSICDNLSCRRHQQNKSAIPWKYLLVNRDLNYSVEHFYERIVTNFISSWYEQFTEDEDFKSELRYCFRFSTATIIRRILELDIGKIITDKLLPCVVRHIDDYLYMQQIGKLKNVRFNEVVLEYLGKRLHAAATNRNNELGYLRNIASALLPHVLPDAYLKCRNYSVIMREILSGWVFLPLMDVLADPNIINSLVILTTTYKPKKTFKISRDGDYVEFLYSNVNINRKSSSFAMTLNKIKNKPDLLYAFMQFLKKYDHVNMLQFCLDVDDFNFKLLMPDLSKKQLDELHSDAQKLYGEYLFRGSFSFINCPSEISEAFQFAMKNPEELLDLSKLLYTAYDHTFNSLECEWLPQFFHSNEFYGYICGSRIISTYTKQLSNKSSFGSPIKDRSKKYDSSNQGSSKISSGLGKIKGVLKPTQPIEGSFFPVDSQGIENGIAEDIFLGDCNSLFRDLSTWKVSIPTYQASPSNKAIYFYVHIECSDLLARDSRKNWFVLRKDQDFYTLKSKLVEFHGETEICDSPLPSRKTGSSIETRITKYEEFLKKLLLKSTLKGSDLLYYFLTTEEDFTIYIAQNATNIQDIGNIYQSVAYKLRKEKGQYLDSFMMSFLNSTGIQKNEKLELTEVGEEIGSFSISSQMHSPKTYRNHIFNDNFGVQYNCLKTANGESFTPEGIGDSAFYLLKHIFKIPNGILKLYASICSVAQYVVEMTSRLFIERTIKSNLSQSNLAHLIKLLEDIVFNPHVSPTKDELKKRQIRAFQELNNSIPTKVTKIFGNGVKDGSSALLEVMQHPHFNKQLAYNLLDIVLLEIYPTLAKDEG
ncbi:unnamed protein product [Phaedon cochleariae]|uniref:Sorting nexin-14-like n=1 Tax=Phaedon cochleariae TaxID=80249 RepID=A0A9N9SDI9_PHACE|nr:unnamed protein product [Phaedon cochleariae]